MNPFSYLRAKYGQPTQKLISEYIDCKSSSTKYKQHATFGHRCKAHNLVPNGFRIKPPIRSAAGHVLAEKCGLRYLQLWIGMCHSKIKSADSSAQRLLHQLGNVLSKEDLSLVESITTQKIERLSGTIRSRQVRKFETLRTKAQSSARMNTPPQCPDLVLNLSKRPLSIDEESILSKGLNFVPTSRYIPVKDILLKVECATSSLGTSEAEIVRRDISNAVTRFKGKGQRNTSSAQRKAIATLRNDKNIVILPADKGRKTVVMDIVEYDQKVMDLLSDTDTYVTITRDPTPSTEVELNRLLRTLVKEKKLTDAQYRHLHASGGQTPRFYGLPKVHKPGNPLRPIVSFVSSPTYNVSRYLSDILSPIALDNKYRATNGAEVADLVQYFTLGEDEEMVSFDVTALFTSIPIDLACTIALDKLQQDGNLHERTALTPDDIITLLRFCLMATYFSYGGHLYKQVFGTAMGSPVSATIADIVMMHIEETTLSSFPFDVSLWKRYVDDILSFLKRQHVRMLLDHLNTFHPRIQFTMEAESDNRLSFLDVQLTRSSDGKITTSVYRKTTHTDSYLRFESDHPPSHKAAVVKTLMGRISTHVTDDLEKSREERHVTDALHRCGYTNRFIKMNTPSPPNDVSEDRDKPRFRAAIPYVSGLSEQISRIFRRHNIGTSYIPGSSLRDLLVHPKDPVPVVSQAGVVYSIPCKACEKSYIGETQRRLGDRLKEHKRAVRDADVTTSALAEHVWENDHAVDWENTKILDRSRNWRERKYRESVAIACENNTINRDRGLELPVPYLNIIKSTL